MGHIRTDILIVVNLGIIWVWMALTTYHIDQVDKKLESIDNYVAAQNKLNDSQTDFNKYVVQFNDNFISWKMETYGK